MLFLSNAAKIYEYYNSFSTFSNILHVKKIKIAILEPYRYLILIKALKLATRRNVKKKGKEKEKKKMEIVRDKKRFFEYFETVRHVISSRRSRLLDSPSPPSLYLSFSFNPSTFPALPPSLPHIHVSFTLCHSMCTSSASIEFSR